MTPLSDSPISILPLELLRKVFIILSNLSTERSKFSYHVGGPLDLDKIPCHPIFRVCKLWREILLETPFLMGHFSVYLTDHFSESRPGYESAVRHKVERWLNRAKGSQLSIEYVDKRNPRNHGQRHFIVDIFYSRVSDWLRLASYGECNLVLPLFESTISVATHLVYLHLKLQAPVVSWSNQMADLLNKTPVVFPALKGMFLHGAMIEIFPKIIAPQLEVLGLYQWTVSSETISQVSRHYESILNLTLKNITLNDLHLLPECGGEEWHFSNLEHIRLVVHGRDSSSFNLASFKDALKLKYLEIGLTSFKEPQTTVLRNITSLKLMFFLEHALQRMLKSIQDLLQSFPNLRYLKLSSTEEHKFRALRVLQLLQLDPTREQHFCPDLKCLDIENCEVDRGLLIALCRIRDQDLQRRMDWKEGGFFVSLKNCWQMPNIQHATPTELVKTLNVSEPHHFSEVQSDLFPISSPKGDINSLYAVA